MQLIRVYQCICLHLKQLQIHFFPRHVENFLSIRFALPLAIPSQHQNLFLTSDPFTLFPESCQKPSNLLLLLLFPYSTVLLTHSPMLVNQGELLYVQLVLHCYRAKGKAEGGFPPAQELFCPIPCFKSVAYQKHFFHLNFSVKFWPSPSAEQWFLERYKTKKSYHFSKWEPY